MDAKELNETVTELYAKLRELSQGVYAGHRVNALDLSEDGSKIQVGGVVYIYSDNFWQEEVGRPAMTTGGLAFECREARRAGKIVEILNIAEEGEEE